MRSILNISLPAEMVKQIKAEVKKNNFSSNSEFVRHLVRFWNTEKLAKELESEKKKFRLGKYKVLKSLKDLR